MTTKRTAGRTQASPPATEAPRGIDLEQAQEQGYIGTVPDETPNENYTVAGQAAGKPTPETAEPKPGGGEPMQPAPSA